MLCIRYAEQASTTNGVVVAETSTEDSKSTESNNDSSKSAEFTSR